MRSWNRPLLAFAAAMVVLIPVAAVGLLVDPRVVAGAPIWAKPLKFAISLALYAVTLAWMLSLLRGERAHRVASVAAAVVAVCGVIEMVAIVGQVVRGVGRHFNTATAFDTAVYAVMGSSITVLWVANLVIAVLLLRERSLAAATGRAVRLGLVVSLLGMAVAFLMTSPSGAQIAGARATGTMPVTGGHGVGASDAAGGLPLLGWSSTGGDLRIPHFVGLHGMQVVPLVALGLLLLAPRVAALRPEGVRIRLVVVAAAGWTGLTALLLWQALRGQPLLAPDAATLVGLAGLVVAAAVATAVIVRQGARAVVGERETAAVSA